MIFNIQYNNNIRSTLTRWSFSLDNNNHKQCFYVFGIQSRFYTQRYLVSLKSKQNKEKIVVTMFNHFVLSQLFAFGNRKDKSEHTHTQIAMSGQLMKPKFNLCFNWIEFCIVQYHGVFSKNYPHLNLTSLSFLAPCSFAERFKNIGAVS